MKGNGGNPIILGQQLPWTKQKLAERLEISSTLQQIGIISQALDVIRTSPLLRGSFPRIPKRNPRKRDDYKCGTCGKKKRNHICHTGTIVNNDYVEGNDGMTNSDEDCNDDDTSPPLKKRKKIFKPLVVIMHHENPAIQQYLEQVKNIGEKNVEVNLSFFHNSQDEKDYNIFGEILLPGTTNYLPVGKVSEYYKEIVKKSLEDSSLTKIELAPIQKIGINVTSGQQPVYLWLVQFILHRNASWRTKKLNEFACWNKKDEES